MSEEVIELFYDDDDEEYDEDDYEPCPEGCHHDLRDHWEITSQVLKCKLCDCAF